MTGTLQLRIKGAAAQSLFEIQDSSAKVLWRVGDEGPLLSCPWCLTSVKEMGLDKGLVCPRCGGNLLAQVS